MFEDLKIGILGGGQLGAMLLRHAIDFGLNVAVLDKDSTVPCARHTAYFTAGDSMNYNDVMAFGRQLDIITIEKESVNIAALKELRELGVKVFPSPETLEIIQDKYVQKKFLSEHHIPVVTGWLVQNREELMLHTDKLPAILKKCTDGYDGKGVMMLRTAEDIARAFDGPYVLEELVDIREEISVMVSRNEAGTIECYDPVLMMFDKELMLLDFQICPAGLDEETTSRVRSIASDVAEAVGLTGILAVEMFIDRNGTIYVNELAPRPHNSGHHTIEAAKTSQFEQQIRIILGLPIGNTDTTSPSVMINVLQPAANRKQALQDALKTILNTSDAHLHWYGKTGGNEGRKIGHITITSQQREEAISKSVMIKNLLEGNHG